MIAFYKIVIDNIIDGFGTNGPDHYPDMHPISKTSYNKLMKMMTQRPADPPEEGYMYALQNDPLEWVQIKIPDPDENI